MSPISSVLLIIDTFDGNMEKSEANNMHLLKMASTFRFSVLLLIYILIHLMVVFGKPVLILFILRNFC